VDAVNRAHIRIPPIQFAMANISKDELKFRHVVGQLVQKSLEEVEDIICNPPAKENMKNSRNT
jgi:16S rRNA G1207 methylase RsmC